MGLIFVSRGEMPIAAKTAFVTFAPSAIIERQSRNKSMRKKTFAAASPAVVDVDVDDDFVVVSFY